MAKNAARQHLTTGNCKMTFPFVVCKSVSSLCLIFNLVDAEGSCAGDVCRLDMFFARSLISVKYPESFLPNLNFRWHQSGVQSITSSTDSTARPNAVALPISLIFLQSQISPLILVNQAEAVQARANLLTLVLSAADPA